MALAHSPGPTFSPGAEADVAQCRRNLGAIGRARLLDGECCQEGRIIGLVDEGLVGAFLELGIESSCSFFWAGLSAGEVGDEKNEVFSASAPTSLISASSRKPSVPMKRVNKPPSIACLTMVAPKSPA